MSFTGALEKVNETLIEQGTATRDVMSDIRDRLAAADRRELNAAGDRLEEKREKKKAKARPANNKSNTVAGRVAEGSGLGFLNNLLPNITSGIAGGLAAGALGLGTVVGKGLKFGAIGLVMTKYANEQIKSLVDYVDDQIPGIELDDPTKENITGALQTGIAARMIGVKTPLGLLVAGIFGAYGDAAIDSINKTYGNENGKYKIPLTDFEIDTTSIGFQTSVGIALSFIVPALLKVAGKRLALFIAGTAFATAVTNMIKDKMPSFLKSADKASDAAKASKAVTAASDARLIATAVEQKRLAQLEAKRVADEKRAKQKTLQRQRNQFRIAELTSRKNLADFKKPPVVMSQLTGMKTFGDLDAPNDLVKLASNLDTPPSMKAPAFPNAPKLDNVIKFPTRVLTAPKLPAGPKVMSQSPSLKTPVVPKNSGTSNFKSVFNTTNIKNVPQKLPSMLDRILESKVTKAAGKVLLPATIALEAYLGQSRPEFQGTSLTATQKGVTNAVTGTTFGVVDFIGNAFIDPFNEILKVQNKAAALLLGEGNFQTRMIGNLETQSAVNSTVGTVLEKINTDLTQRQVMDAALVARFGTLDPSSKVEGGNLPAARFSSAFPDNYGRMRGNITPGGEMNALDAIAADNLAKAIADARATGIPPVAIATADNNSVNNSNTQVTTINGATSASDTAFDLYQLAH